ncbi:MAG: hypothetical protein JOZ81_18395 [Chloroflexi bacterium]|nr:hypothetical protein [Chloroflexota bacterium]
MSPRRTIFRAQDNFDPSYLERYQLGYTPDDKTAYWFPADPVAAHFSVDHVAPLAELYGHKLTVRVTRTDTPAAQPDPGQSFDASGMVELVAIDRGSPADQRLVAAVATIRAAGEAPCAVPGSGSSLVAGPLLAKQAHYDLDVFFPTAPGAPGAPGPALPGVVFSTSRYQDPGDLLTQLGFSVAGPVPTVRGDVRVQATPIVGNGTGDSALEDALARLGLTPWPNAPVARTSALWVESGADWLLRGVLMEAPEPLFRPGPPPSAAEKSPPPRFGISSLSCSGGTFDVVRQNASRTALLWLASTPFVPAGPLVLQVVARPPLVDPKSLPATTTLTGSCQVGPVPPFVADIA